MYRYPNMGYGDYTEDMYDNYEPYYYNNMYSVPPMYQPVAMYPVNPYMMYNSMNYNMQPAYESTYEPFDYYDDEDHEDDEFQNLKMRTVDISDIID